MLCTAITTGAGVTAGAKAVLHVSPDGRDDNPGSREEPLASLAGARDRVREVKAAGDAVTVVFAAAAIVALETMIPRLAEDHVRARRLGELLADMDGNPRGYGDRANQHRARGHRLHDAGGVQRARPRQRRRSERARCRFREVFSPIAASTTVTSRRRRRSFARSSPRAELSHMTVSQWPFSVVK